jgi:nucleoside-diphosphate-sugar epimerase
VLVAGGSGFIGSYLCNMLIEYGHQVASLDNYSSYVDVVDEGLVYQIKLFRKEQTGSVEKFRADVRHETAFLVALFDYKPDVVINLANLPLANRSHRNPSEAFEGIVKSTYHLLSAVSEYKERARGDVKLIHISSSMVYGDFTKDPQPENVILRPKDIYGCFKAASESMVTGFSNNKGFPATIIRPSAVYGFGGLNQRVVQKFVEGAVLRHPLQAVNPEHTYLDFTYVEDTARGIMLSMEKLCEGVTGTFNITTGEAKSIKHLIEIITGQYPETRVDELYKETYRPTRGTLDISMAKEVLGYKPKWSLETGVEKYLLQTEQAKQCLQVAKK